MNNLIIIFGVLFLVSCFGVTSCNNDTSKSYPIPEPTNVTLASVELNADAGGPYYTFCGDEITLNGTGSSSPYMVKIIYWKLSDNFTVLSGKTTLTPRIKDNNKCSYLSKSYDIKLFITDILGNQSIDRTTITLGTVGSVGIPTPTPVPELTPIP